MLRFGLFIALFQQVFHHDRPLGDIAKVVNSKLRARPSFPAFWTMDVNGTWDAVVSGLAGRGAGAELRSYGGLQGLADNVAANVAIEAPELQRLAA